MTRQKLGLEANAEPALRRIRVNDCELAYVERHLELKGHGPTLLLVHATGFHARVWDQIIARLPACHSIALDQRGHGRSEKTSIDDWRTLGQDQAALVEALDDGSNLVPHEIPDGVPKHALLFAQLEIHVELLAVLSRPAPRQFSL